MQVTVEEAKTILPELCELAQAGLEVTIMKDGKPYIRFEACEESRPAKNAERKPGALKGHIWMAPDFDEPLEFAGGLVTLENHD